MSDFKLAIGNKNYSSWSLRAWLAVTASGRAFEEILLPLDTPEFAEKIQALNPSGTVPALWHNGQLVWDSLAIIDYLDRVVDDYDYWPFDSVAYGYARSIVSEMHSGLFALRANLPMNMREQFTDLGFAEPVQANIDRVETLWTEALERFSNGGPYLFGDTLTGADMMFAPVVSRFRTYGVKLNDRCESYRSAIENNEHYQAWYQAGIKEDWIVDQDEVDRNVKILGSV